MIKTAISKSRFIFISYASEDKQHAEALLEALNQHSIDTWASFNNLEAGDIWDERIEEAITKASAVCVLASKNSVESRYVRAEIETAIKLEKMVVPICIDDCKLPLRWNMHQHITWEVQGFRSKPKNTSDFFHSLLDGTLENVVIELGAIFPKSTRNEYARLLESPDEEMALKELIKTFYEWIPDWRHKRYYYESQYNGGIFTDWIIAGEPVDICIVEKNSGGTNDTYLYLGPVHCPPSLSDGLISPEFLDVIQLVERHIPHINYGDSTHVIIIYGRRLNWTGEANAIRKEIQKEWPKRFPGAHLTIMSYDRLLK